MSRKRRIILAVVIVLMGIISIVFGAKLYIESDLVKLTDATVMNVDLSKVGDGSYTGSYKVFPVAAEVKVTVEKHRIESIELVKHSNGQGATAEVIPDRVIEAQSLEVDMVSGATYSSKVILKAIESALKNANQ